MGPAHWGATSGWRELFGAGGVWFCLRVLCRTVPVKAKWQESGVFAVGQETEVPDAHKTSDVEPNFSKARCGSSVDQSEVSRNSKYPTGYDYPPVENAADFLYVQTSPFNM